MDGAVDDSTINIVVVIIIIIIILAFSMRLLEHTYVQHVIGALQMVMMRTITMMVTNRAFLQLAVSFIFFP